MPILEAIAKAEALIRRYFQACNDADFQGLVNCFTEEAVHYFPLGLPATPWRGTPAIAEGWVGCVATLGSRWTIEKILVAAPDGREAAIEWTHWKTAIGEVLRGDEWYVFTDDIARIAEIRAYYAFPVNKAEPVNRLHEFDYAARGYALQPPRPRQNSPRDRHESALSPRFLRDMGIGFVWFGSRSSVSILAMTAWLRFRGRLSCYAMAAFCRHIGRFAL